MRSLYRLIIYSLKIILIFFGKFRTLFIIWLSILTLYRWKLSCFNFFVLPKVFYFHFNPLFFFGWFFYIISQLVYFTLKRIFRDRQIIFFLTYYLIKFFNRSLDPLLERFIINQNLILNTSKSFDYKGKIFCFQLVFIIHFQNIIKLISCDISIVVFINLLDC